MHYVKMPLSHWLVFVAFVSYSVYTLYSLVAYPQSCFSFRSWEWPSLLPFNRIYRAFDNCWLRWSQDVKDTHFSPKAAPYQIKISILFPWFIFLKPIKSETLVSHLNVRNIKVEIEWAGILFRGFAALHAKHANIEISNNILWIVVHLFSCSDLLMEIDT